jgi:hypothetical protein
LPVAVLSWTMTMSKSPCCSRRVDQAAADGRHLDRLLAPQEARSTGR